MKKSKVIVVLAMMLLVFAVCVPISAKAATYTWKSVGNGNYKCYKNGKLVKNAWVNDKHLNSSGLMDRNKWVSKKVNGVTKKVFVRDDGKWVKNFKAGWQKIGSKYYWYTAAGKLLKNQWVRVPLKGKYYVNSKGYRVTGLQKMKDGYRYFTSSGLNKTGWQTIKGKRYYFMSTTGLALTDCIYKFKSNGKSYCFDKNGVRLTGWQKRNNKWYYFKNEMKTGWVTVSGKKYYCAKGTGARVTGIYSIGGKLYYFDTSTGVMQKNKTVTYKGRKYVIAANGVCTLATDSSAPSANMLFFLTFESGSAAYNQTGGDNGNACGAYQFDYRYSLLNFVKYAYGKNAKLCKEFKTYAGYTSGAKLKSNSKFYTAWHTIYKRDKKAFAALQDTFAKVNYYDPVETTLARAGINLGTRSDVVKGAVYSYSIQHGQSSAVSAVKACKITSTTTDKQFLTKLYKYRIKKYPAYENRYQQEYALALKKL
ncbi:MAG: hypothetical protein Q4C50_04485 [Eubacteriales bacterium]|nr:hypothetical protein [Eubacteriales bacterium]